MPKLIYTLLKFNFIQEPEEIVLGEEIINTATGNKRRFKVKRHSYRYVPDLKVLQQLLNQVDVFSQVPYGIIFK